MKVHSSISQTIHSCVNPLIQIESEVESASDVPVNEGVDMEEEK
jgi:hypothetical protein